MSQTVLSRQVEAQNAEIKTSLRKILGKVASSDEQLWKLRLDEVTVWQTHAGSGSGETQTDLVMGQVRAVLARRGEAIVQAMNLIDTLDATYVALRSHASEAADSVDAARLRFDHAEANIKHRLQHDPAMIAFADDERRMKGLIDKNADWETDLEAIIAPRLGTYDRDAVFQYLLSRGWGTDTYKAKWPISALDAKLAKWTSFVTEKENLERVTDYPAGFGKEITRLKSAFEALPAKRAALTRTIKDSLDPEREVLAKALNGASSVVEKFEKARDTKTETVSKLRSYINGADVEYKLITDAVISLTATVRTAAALRSASTSELTSGSPVADLVDGLLKQRIAIAKGADQLRQDALSMLDRIGEIQKLLDEAARKEVGEEQFEFVLAKTRVDLI